jgi:hypothetical protein
MRLRIMSAIVLLVTVSLGADPGAAGSKPGAATSKQCLTISGTGDGINKRVAMASSQEAVHDEIAKLQTEKHFENFDAKAWKPDPRPYWRSSVSTELFLPPDEITDQLYTICWKGVVSPAVCTSGTEICWQPN